MQTRLLKPSPRRRRSALGFVALLFVALYVPRLINPAEPQPARHGASETTEKAPTAEAVLAELEKEDQSQAGGEISRVLVALFVVLLAAKMGGEVLERVGQPAVLGELAFGVLIGNLGLIGIHNFEYMKDDTVVEILAEIGVILLLFEVGLESNLREMASVGLSSFLVAVFGVIAPFFLGWGVAAFFWKDLVELMPPDVQAEIGPYATYIHIFIGAVLCATSVGITARVLQDLGKIKTREARIILGAAVFDDVLGLIILAVCVGVIGAVGGGKPLLLGKIEKTVVQSKISDTAKIDDFLKASEKHLKDRKRSGFVYDTRSGRLQPIPARPMPEFRKSLESQMDAVRAGRKLSADAVPMLDRVERFDDLGLRLYLKKKEFGAGNILWIVLISIAFFVGIVLAGLLLVQPIYRFASLLRVHGVLLTFALMICFVCAFIASRIGLAPIVGAFAAGLILEDVHFRDLPDRRKHSLPELLAPLTTFLTPVFFVRMGITVDLSSFANVSILGFAFALTVAAILGKQVCSFGVVERGVDRLAVGLGMIPRGEVGLIFAAEGAKLTLGHAPVIDADVLSAVVIMVMITTLVTPPVLKWKLVGRRRKKAKS